MGDRGDRGGWVGSGVGPAGLEPVLDLGPVGQDEGRRPVMPPSLRLADLLLGRLRLVVSGGELLAHRLPEGLLEEAAGLAAFAAREAFRLDPRLALRADDDPDELLHAWPPTSSSTTMDPSASDCSDVA